MEFVENLPEKLKEIRAKPIYRKYIDSMQEIYDNEIENPVYTPNLTDYSEFFKSGGRMNYENKYFLRRKGSLLPRFFIFIMKNRSISMSFASSFRKG